MDTPLQERIQFFENELIALYQQQKIENLTTPTYDRRKVEQLSQLKLLNEPPKEEEKKPPLRQSRVPPNFVFKEQWLRLTDCKYTGDNFHIYFDLVPAVEGYTFVKTINLKGDFKHHLDYTTRDCWSKTYKNLGSAEKQFLKHTGCYFWAEVVKSNRKNFPYQIRSITEWTEELPKGVL